MDIPTPSSAGEDESRDPDHRGVSNRVSTGSAAVNLAGAVNVDDIHTYAWIGANAKVNCDAGCTDVAVGS
ncbi:hypothetical protein, partial [Agromyces humi]|uniref:hypothetical protein n=1 Tax=Agromyces humi TaxID=1766800 RepID=UPI0013588927